MFSKVSFFDSINAMIPDAEKYIKEHPEETLDQVAKATGYNSRSAISYIYKRFGKGAPRAEENKK